MCIYFLYYFNLLGKDVCYIIYYFFLFLFNIKYVINLCLMKNVGFLYCLKIDG